MKHGRTSRDEKAECISILETENQRQGEGGGCEGKRKNIYWEYGTGWEADDRLW